MSDDNSDQKWNRRKLLQTTAALGAGSAVFTGSAFANDDETPDDLRVVDTNELSNGKAQRHIAKLNGSGPVRALERELTSDSGLTSSASVAIAVETNDETVNEANPVLVVSGFEPERAEENSAGLLMCLVAETEDRGSSRGPVAAFALSAEGVEEATVSHQDSSDAVTLKAYGYADDGTPEVTGEEVVNPTDGVSTQGFHGALGCGACIAIVNELCDKSTGAVSRTACLKACAPFLGSVWGYGACGAACIVIVDTINDYGCAVAATTICAAVGVCDG